MCGNFQFYKKIEKNLESKIPIPDENFTKHATIPTTIIVKLLRRNEGINTDNTT